MNLCVTSSVWGVAGHTEEASTTGIFLTRLIKYHWHSYLIGDRIGRGSAAVSTFVFESDSMNATLCLHHPEYSIITVLTSTIQTISRAWKISFNAFNDYASKSAGPLHLEKTKVRQDYTHQHQFITMVWWETVIFVANGIRSTLVQHQRSFPWRRFGRQFHIPTLVATTSWIYSSHWFALLQDLVLDLVREHLRSLCWSGVALLKSSQWNEVILDDLRTIQRKYCNGCGRQKYSNKKRLWLFSNHIPLHGPIALLDELQKLWNQADAICSTIYGSAREVHHEAMWKLKIWKQIVKRSAIITAGEMFLLFLTMKMRSMGGRRWLNLWILIWALLSSLTHSVQ